MAEALQTIQAFVAPVVVISANGLLCLAFYNRMTAVINRSRTINKERFDLLTRRAALAKAPADPAEAVHLDKRLHILDELGHQLFERVQLIRDALIFLLAAVLCMLGCSLSLGLVPLGARLGRWLGLDLAVLQTVLDGTALVLFILGIAVMARGIVKAIRELKIALSPLLFEHAMIERSPHHPLPPPSATERSPDAGLGTD